MSGDEALPPRTNLRSLDTMSTLTLGTSTQDLEADCSEGWTALNILVCGYFDMVREAGGQLPHATELEGLVPGAGALLQWAARVWVQDSETGLLCTSTVRSDHLMAYLNPYQQQYLLSDAIEAVNAAWLQRKLMKEQSAKTETLSEAILKQRTVVRSKVQADFEHGRLKEADVSRRMKAVDAWMATKAADIEADRRQVIEKTSAACEHAATLMLQLWQGVQNGLQAHFKSMGTGSQVMSDAGDEEHKGRDVDMDSAFAETQPVDFGEAGNDQEMDDNALLAELNSGLEDPAYTSPKNTVGLHARHETHALSPCSPCPSTPGHLPRHDAG